MRNDISFQTQDGLKLCGWFYTPDAPGGPFPTIVMAHGFSGVKELYLDKYAKAFADNGFATLVFDHRNYGDSEGIPRFEIDPLMQIRDYRDAITYATTLDTVDSNRIGIWGSSYSGGHVLKVGAYDRRVKCVVTQVPDISGSTDLRLSTRPDLLPELFSAFEADRVARFMGEEPAYISVVSEDPNEGCALPGSEAFDFMMGANLPANWSNKVTLKSIELLNEYEPASDIDRIRQFDPLRQKSIMVAAVPNHTTPKNLEQAAEVCDLLLVCTDMPLIMDARLCSPEIAFLLHGKPLVNIDLSGNRPSSAAQAMMSWAAREQVHYLQSSTCLTNQDWNAKTSTINLQGAKDICRQIPLLSESTVDRLLQRLSSFFPRHLPARMDQYRDQYEHHLLLKVPGTMRDEVRGFLEQFGSMYGDSGYFECTMDEGRKAFLHRFAAAGAAVRYRAVHSKEVEDIVALDIALRRNDEDWFETLPQVIDQHIIKKLYYGHFLCNVFHQDYIVKKGIDCPSLEHKMWHLLDSRRAQYPAEHNVGHLYKAPPALAAFYRSIDPCNQFNPGIGQTSKCSHWR